MNMNDSSNNANKEKKKTQGKLKIEIKKIEKSSSRAVTFSKRRSGLFKKASELSVTTGAEVGILVQSVGGGHVFTYGNPDVDTVIDRYEKDHSDALRMKQEEYDTICKDIEAEKKKGIVDFEDKEGNLWWNIDVKDLDYEELEKHLAALVLLKKNVMARADDLKVLEEGQAKSKSMQSSDSTSSGVDCGLDNHPGYVDCVFDRSVAGNASKEPSIGVIDQMPAVENVSGTHEELDLELRL